MGDLRGFEAGLGSTPELELGSTPTPTTELDLELELKPPGGGTPPVKVIGRLPGPADSKVDGAEKGGSKVDVWAKKGV